MYEVVPLYVECLCGITVRGCTTICRVFVWHHCMRLYHNMSSVASLYEGCTTICRVFVWHHCMRLYHYMSSVASLYEVVPLYVECLCGITVWGCNTICRVFVWHHCRRLYACVINMFIALMAETITSTVEI